MKKVKCLEEKLQHVPTVASEEPKDSRKGKRDSTHFSSSKEEGLHKPLRQPRHLE